MALQRWIRPAGALSTEQQMLDRFETGAVKFQRLTNRGFHVFRAVASMQLQHFDKLPGSAVVSPALAQLTEQDLIFLRPVRSPLPNRAGAFKRPNAPVDQRQVVQRIDLPFTVAEQSRMVRYQLMIRIEANSQKLGT